MFVFVAILICFLSQSILNRQESVAASVDIADQLLAVSTLIIGTIVFSSMICLILNLSTDSVRNAKREQRSELAERFGIAIWFTCCLSFCFLTKWSIATQVIAAKIPAGATLLFLIPPLFTLFVVWMLFAFQATGSVSESFVRVGVRFRVQVLTMFVPLLGFQLCYDLVVLSGLETSIALPLICVLFVMSILVLMPNLVAIVLPTRSIRETELGQHLIRLSRELKSPVNDIRLWSTNNRILNGMVSGILPFNRKVFLTDRLICLMNREEIDAIFFHEVGHAKRHHLILRMIAAIVPFLVIQQGFEAIMPGTGLDLVLGGLTALASLSFFAKLLEYDADRFAVEMEKRFSKPPFSERDNRESTPAFYDALRKIRSDNPASNFSGWLHPGIGDRLQRLIENEPRFKEALRTDDHGTKEIAEG